MPSSSHMLMHLRMIWLKKEDTTKNIFWNERSYCQVVCFFLSPLLRTSFWKDANSNGPTRYKSECHISFGMDVELLESKMFIQYIFDQMMGKMNLGQWKGCFVHQIDLVPENRLHFHWKERKTACNRKR